MEFLIPKPVKLAIQTMKKNGFESFIVGGSVRDFLMGKTPADYDITTNATPEETKRCFSGFKVIETGIKHGTVTVLIFGEPIEITTYRIDGKYLDNRHPESVSFTVNLEEDLSRRDFTVNALAYDGEQKIVDLFSGKEDLKNKIIRCVGEPDKRFLEDGLRILRALRFSSVLGFKIEEETEKSIRKNKELLKNISTERILVELTKLLCGICAEEILLSFREVFEVFIPDLKNFTEYEKNVHSLMKTEPLKELRFGAFLAECREPKKILRELKLDNKSRDFISSLIIDLKEDMKPDRICLKKMLITRDFSQIRSVIALKKAFGEDEKKCNAMENIIDDIEKQGECVKISQLAVDGNDVKSAGGFSGKQIGEVLSNLLYMVIDGKINNNREEIMKFLQQN